MQHTFEPRRWCFVWRVEPHLFIIEVLIGFYA
jgi:hypothetical protein